MSKIRFYRLLLALLGLLGISLQIYQDGWGMLLYYTVLSNILVISFLFYLVYKEGKSGPIIDKQTLRAKAAVTMAITITFMVYHFMLAPLIEDPKEFWNLRNFLVHYIVPVGFIIDTLVLDRTKMYRWFDPIWWTAAPLLYFIFALFNGLVLKLPIPGAEDSPFAYFFINVTKYGWMQVGQNTLVILITYIFAGYVLLSIKTLLGQRQSL
ncbi:Pr6Pr family membrane protein [Streptococcus hyovaginalis]|nr:Pr6Pr family membrane protein [Streptococcus hyovaginalis]MDY5974129.1 Pr6Pr family membrane protein [Streptococcus hyovaginalis]